MIKQSLYIKNADGTSFPRGKKAAVIGSFTFSAQRMGNAPTITASLNYPICLDSFWNGDEYVEFKGNKYHINRIPDSSKNNDSFMYKHELSFVDERHALNDIFFLDVVSENTETQYADRFRSNTTKFSFMGTAKEFAARLNDSMEYSGLCKKVNGKWEGYRIIVDGIDDTKTIEVNFDNTYLADAIQLFSKSFNLNYYWIGKVCHIGDFETRFSEPLEYKKGLLSVAINDTNNKTFNRITGCGSSDNIPFYYPNDNPEGEAIVSTENISADRVEVDLQKVKAYINDPFNIPFTLCKYQASSLSLSIPLYNSKVKEIEELDEQPYPESILGLKTKVYVFRVKTAIYGYFPKYADINIEGINGVSDYKEIIKLYDALKKYALNATVTQDTYGIISGINGTDYDENKFYKNINIFMDGWYKVEIVHEFKCSLPEGIKADAAERSNLDINGSVQFSYRPTSIYSFRYNDKIVPYDESGIKIANIETADAETTSFEINKVSKAVEGSDAYVFSVKKTGSGTRFAIVNIRGSKYITPCSNLMPTVYRDSMGEKRFYEAKNDGYVETFDGKSFDYEGLYNGLKFANIYSKINQNEGKQDFENIKPTIEGVENAEHKLFGEVLDVAFDLNDSDVLVEGADKDSEDYLHSYFYIKLNVFNGRYGFNLFEHAIESDTAKINMTSGNCAACAFEIAVEKEQKGNFYVFYNPVVTDESGNLLRLNSDTNSGYLGDAIVPISRREKWVERQQHTEYKEVWIAVKKETSTYGVLMPNATHNYRPQKGDKFVITGLKMPKPLVLAAEDRLSKELIAYMKDNNEVINSVSITLSRNYLHSHEDFVSRLNENSLLSVKYDNKIYELYVTNYTCKADNDILYEITLDLDVKLVVSTSQTEQQLSALEARLMSMMGGAGGYSLDQIRQFMKDFFLSKVDEDSASKLIKFLGGIQALRANIDKDLTVDGNTGTSDFISSLSAGRGWRIDGRGNGQLESLEVRSSLRVLELVYNRLSAESSEYIFTESGTVDGATRKADGTYDLKIRRRSSTDFTDFREGDVLKGIVNELENMGGGAYYTVWCYINSVDVNENIINVTAYGSSTPIYKDGSTEIDYFSTEETPSGKNYEPKEMMVFHRWGNKVLPTESSYNAKDSQGNRRYTFIVPKGDGYINTRQSCWYISSIEKRIVMLDNVFQPILTDLNYAAFFGLPFDLKEFKGHSMDETQPYLYCRGAFLQDIHYIDYKGNVIKMERYRGVWSADIAKGDDPYVVTKTTFDTVYWNNAKWECVVPLAKGEPTATNTEWKLLQVAVDGESATLYRLTPSSTIIKRDSDGYPNVSNVTCIVEKITGSQVTLEPDDNLYCLINGIEMVQTSSVELTKDDEIESLEFILMPEVGAVFDEAEFDFDTFAVPLATASVSIVSDGSNGKDGESGNGISEVVEEYGVSTDADVQPTYWADLESAQSWWDISYKYLWNRETTYYSGDKEADVNTHIVAIYTKDGEQGRGIKSITNYYKSSNKHTGESRNEGTWYENPESAVLSRESKYLWNYEKILYTDNTSSYTEPSIIGVYSSGSKGERGAILRGPSEWNATAQYMGGNDSEEYQDMVVRVVDGVTEYFLCRYTHTGVDPHNASHQANSNWSADRPWQKSQVSDFVATKVLFAERGRIENLDIYNATIRGTITSDTDRIDGSEENKTIIVDAKDMKSLTLASMDSSHRMVVLPMLFNYYDEDSLFEVKGYSVSGTTLKIQTEPCIDVLNWASYELNGWKDYPAQILKLFQKSTLVCADPFTLVAHSENGRYYPDHVWHGANITVQSDTYMHGRFSCRGILSRFILLPPGQSLTLTSSIQKVGTKECLVWNVENASDFEPINIIMTDRSYPVSNEYSNIFYDTSLGMNPNTGDDTWKDVLLSYKGMDWKVYNADYTESNQMDNSIKICINFATCDKYLNAKLPFWQPVFISTSKFNRI